MEEGPEGVLLKEVEAEEGIVTGGLEEVVEQVEQVSILEAVAVLLLEVGEAARKDILVVKVIAITAAVEPVQQVMDLIFHRIMEGPAG